jgi:hypothetical protein
VVAIKQNENVMRDPRRGVYGYEDKLERRYFEMACEVKREAVRHAVIGSVAK